MNKKYISLDGLSIGQNCRILRLAAVGSQRRRMLDLGLVSGTRVEMVHESPSGDISAYLVRGSVIALRSEDASQILVELCK